MLPIIVILLQVYSSPISVAFKKFVIIFVWESDELVILEISYFFVKQLHKH
jgi:hypothetical protein